MNDTAPTLDELNQMSLNEFATKLKMLYEHSSWVVVEAADARPFSSIKSMQAVFESVIFGADSESQQQLIDAHPDLAAKLDQIAELTDFSQAEQKRAGFASLPTAELNALRTALAKYRQHFGHPFILCVSEHSADEVLPILEARSTANKPSEKIACLAQITRIGWHRLTQLVSD